MIKWNHWKHILIQIYQKYKHCASLVNTVDSILAKKEMRLLSKLCPPPFSTGYCPKLDALAELKQEGIQ